MTLVTGFYCEYLWFGQNQIRKWFVSPVTASVPSLGSGVLCIWGQMFFDCCRLQMSLIFSRDPDCRLVQGPSKGILHRKVQQQSGETTFLWAMKQQQNYCSSSWGRREGQVPGRSCLSAWPHFLPSTSSNPRFAHELLYTQCIPITDANLLEGIRFI